MKRPVKLQWLQPKKGDVPHKALTCQQTNQEGQGKPQATTPKKPKKSPEKSMKPQQIDEEGHDVGQAKENTKV